jgi:hypothetical protein
MDGCRFRFRRTLSIDQQRKGFVPRERKAWHTARLTFALAFGCLGECPGMPGLLIEVVRKEQFFIMVVVDPIPESGGIEMRSQQPPK